MYETYIVQKGDTMEMIAKKFQVPIYELVINNGLETAYEIVPGMKLQIPVNKQTAFQFYTIKKGDTLIGICIKRYGSDKRVAEICALNNIENPDDIKVDDKILLP